MDHKTGIRHNSPGGIIQMNDYFNRFRDLKMNRERQVKLDNDLEKRIEIQSRIGGLAVAVSNGENSEIYFWNHELTGPVLIAEREKRIGAIVEHDGEFYDGNWKGKIFNTITDEEVQSYGSSVWSMRSFNGKLYDIATEREQSYFHETFSGRLLHSEDEGHLKFANGTDKLLYTHKRKYYDLLTKKQVDLPYGIPFMHKSSLVVNTWDKDAKKGRLMEVSADGQKLGKVIAEKEKTGWFISVGDRLLYHIGGWGNINGWYNADTDEKIFDEKGSIYYYDHPPVLFDSNMYLNYGPDIFEVSDTSSSVFNIGKHIQKMNAVSPLVAKKMLEKHYLGEIR